LTQVSRDASACTSITKDWRYETAAFAVPGRFPMTDTQGLSPVQALAKQLTEDDWAYVVEKLVDRCPDAYPAIIAELDKLVAG
jgi:hypothetical protein